MTLWSSFRKTKEKEPPKISRSRSDLSVEGKLRVPGRTKTALSPGKPRSFSPVASSAPKSMLLGPGSKKEEATKLGTDSEGTLAVNKDPFNDEKSDSGLGVLAKDSEENLDGTENPDDVKELESQKSLEDVKNCGNDPDAEHPEDPQKASKDPLSTSLESSLKSDSKADSPKWVKLSSKPIFSGANGTIFKASDAANTKFVVIKSVRKQPAQTYQNYALSVQREYDNLQKCAACKNVVEVYDLVAEPGPEPELSLIIKYFQYGDLLDYLCDLRSKKIHIPTHLKDAIFKQIVKAVDFLHRHDVVHRDIKPENFLIDVNGEIKLNDFGYSVDLARAQEQLPLNDDCCGTPSFKAPELYRLEKLRHNERSNSEKPKEEKKDKENQQPEDKEVKDNIEQSERTEKREELNLKSVDVWALGILCFQVFLMSVPWQTSSLYDERNKKMVAYMENYPDGPNQLRSLVDKLSDKNYNTALNPALALFKKVHYDARIELLRMLHPNPHKRTSCGELLQSSWLTQAYAKPGDLLSLRKKT